MGSICSDACCLFLTKYVAGIASTASLAALRRVGNVFTHKFPLKYYLWVLEGSIYLSRSASNLETVVGVFSQ